MNRLEESKMNEKEEKGIVLGIVHKQETKIIEEP